MDSPDIFLITLPSSLLWKFIANGSDYVEKTVFCSQKFALFCIL